MWPSRASGAGRPAPWSRRSSGRRRVESAWRASRGSGACRRSSSARAEGRCFAAVSKISGSAGSWWWRFAGFGRDAGTRAASASASAGAAAAVVRRLRRRPRGGARGPARRTNGCLVAPHAAAVARSRLGASRGTGGRVVLPAEGGEARPQGSIFRGWAARIWARSWSRRRSVDASCGDDGRSAAGPLARLPARRPSAARPRPRTPVAFPRPLGLGELDGGAARPRPGRRRRQGR